MKVSINEATPPSHIFTHMAHNRGQRGEVAQVVRQAQTFTFYKNRGCNIWTKKKSAYPYVSKSKL